MVQPSDLASGGSRYNPAELMYQVRARLGRAMAWLSAFCLSKFGLLHRTIHA